MKRYYPLISIELQRQFVYRFNMLAYRCGTVFEVMTQLIIWTAVFQGNTLVAGYNYREMMTYVLLGWFFMFFTYTFGFEQVIARQIHTGELSNFLLKPISYIRYIMVLSLGRNIPSFITSLTFQGIFILVLHNTILPPVDPKVFFLIVPMLIIGYGICVFSSIIVGLLAFWTHDVDGIFFAFRIIMRFLSGAYFPISVLPLALFNLFSFFPFIYTMFIPIQLYLGKINFSAGVKGLLIELVWLAGLYGLVRLLWKIGVKKKYEGIGI
jgi:ABC-2 type transport system permease protein